MYTSDAKKYAFLPLCGYLLVILLTAMGLHLEKIGSGYEAAILMLLMIILLVVVGIYTVIAEVKFMIEAAKSPYLSTFKKILWAFFLYGFNVIAFPLYWFFHFYRIEKEEREAWKKVQRENREAYFYDAKLTPEERKDIRRRNREFTHNQRKEKWGQAVQENVDEFRLAAISGSKSRAMSFFTFVPILLLLCDIVLQAYELSFGMKVNDFNYTVIPAIRDCVLLLIIVCDLIAVVLFGIHTWNNELFSKKMKIGWTLLLMVFNLLAYPVYWDKYIRRSSEKQDVRRKKAAFIFAIIPVLLLLMFIGVNGLGSNILGMDVAWLLLELTYRLFPLAYIFTMLIYSLKVCEYDRLQTSRKVLWIFGFVLLGMIMCPAYYLWWNGLQEKDIKNGKP